MRNRFQGTWVRGFEIAEVTDDGYRIRRMSDGSVLGELFSRDDVRRESDAAGLLVALRASALLGLQHTLDVVVDRDGRERQRLERAP